MDYMTVREAAEKWELKVRMVNYYCAAGRIEGAVRFSRAWAIPKDAVKPQDGRYKETGEKLEIKAGLLQFAPEKDEFLAQAVELFPYAIAIFTPDGTLTYANKAYFEFYHTKDKAAAQASGGNEKEKVSQDSKRN